jgi:hypothetical protein
VLPDANYLVERDPPQLTWRIETGLQVAQQLRAQRFCEVA